jgi:hypothetical protein
MNFVNEKINILQRKKNVVFELANMQINMKIKFQINIGILLFDCLITLRIHRKNIILNSIYS